MSSADATTNEHAGTDLSAGAQPVDLAVSGMLSHGKVVSIEVFFYTTQDGVCLETSVVPR